jgi:hypothetical protein
MLIRKDVVFQVVLDLCDPYIGTSLRIGIMHAEVHKIPCDAYYPWQAPGK